MKIKIHSLIFAMSSLAVMSRSCPSDHFSAIFTGTIDQTVDNPGDVYVDDPEQTFTRSSGIRNPAAVS